jgi:hypothetical protein
MQEKVWWRNFLETELYGGRVGDGENVLKWILRKNEYVTWSGMA